LRICRRHGHQPLQIGQRRLELVPRLSDRGPQQQRLGGRRLLVPPRRQRRLGASQESWIAAGARRRDQHPRQARRRVEIARVRVERASQARALRGGRIAPARRDLRHDLAVGDRAPRPRHRGRPGARPRAGHAHRHHPQRADHQPGRGPPLSRVHVGRHHDSRKMMPAPARQRLLSALLR
jgi:hypothetical protein